MPRAKTSATGYAAADEASSQARLAMQREMSKISRAAQHSDIYTMLLSLDNVRQIAHLNGNAHITDIVHAFEAMLGRHSQSSDPLTKLTRHYSAVLNDAICCPQCDNAGRQALIASLAVYQAC